ncbi:HAD family hydrolase [Pseudomonadota bacterium]
MTLAIFDLDNSLLNGDSDHSWGEYLVKKRIVDGEYYSKTNARHFADYNAGRLDFDEFIRFQLAPLKDNPREIMERIRKEFLSEIIEPMMSANACSLVNHHRKQGHTLMIITATNRFITRPIADKFGIDLLIATEVEEIDGSFTGRTIGTPSFGEGKVDRLKEWLSGTTESLTESWFYSDSHNDLPLMRLVDNPVALKPDDKLRKVAKLNQWKIIDW